eukprot:4420307-Prymnesium_polylepis.1
MFASLHGARGGPKSKRTHIPSESEGLALAAAGAMQWAKLRDPSHREFWRTVANEVKRAGGSQQN